MRLDMTITFGNLLQIGATAVLVVSAYIKLREQLVSLSTKIEPLWNEYTDRRHVARRAEDRD